jgi:ABC-type transport system involved in cytochrome bd biosynthesis fused ATPase/permease subunit
LSTSSLGVALAVLDRRSRLHAITIAALGSAERGFLVALALVLASDHRRQALLASLALFALWALRAYLRVGLRVQLERKIHEQAAQALLGGDPLDATPLTDGDADTILVDGVHPGSVLLADRLPQLAGDAVAVLAILAYLAATQSAHVLLVGGAAVVLAGVAGFLARRMTAGAQDSAWHAYRPLVERMMVVVRGRMELVANGVEAAFTRRLGEQLDTYEAQTLRAERLSGLAGRMPIAAGALGIGVALFLESGFASRGGAVLAEAALFASVLPAFVGLAQSAHESWKLSLVFRPMAALLSIPRFRCGGSAAPPKVRHAMRLDDVTFRYAGAARDALRGVSLAFELGQPLVLSGPNGSGKSTVLRLLAGLGTPGRGVVSVGGTDLATLDGAAWRAGVAYLPQSPHLPEGMTIEEVMHVLALDASPAAIREALERVGVLDTLLARASDAPLAVRVAVLSTGQRKRVALARVLLADAQLVLLDEPDANLDADGVAMVARITEELAATRLVAIAAHTASIVAARGVHVELAA